VREQSFPDDGTPVRVRDGSTLEWPAWYHPLPSLLGCAVSPDQPISWGGVAETPQHRAARRVRPRMPNPSEPALTTLHVAP
jgi:hypothetical protein